MLAAAFAAVYTQVLIGTSLLIAKKKPTNPNCVWRPQRQRQRPTDKNHCRAELNGEKKKKNYNIVISISYPDLCVMMTPD